MKDLIILVAYIGAIFLIMVVVLFIKYSIKLKVYKDTFKLFYDKIEAVYEPDEQIKIVKEALNWNRNQIKEVTLNYSNLYEVILLLRIAIAYEQKGDYTTAYNFCKEYRNFIAINETKIKKDKENIINFEDLSFANKLIEIECYINLEKEQEAELLMNELLNELPCEYPKKFCIEIVHAGYLLHKRDIAAVRELLSKVKPALIKWIEQHDNDNNSLLLYDIIFIEAKIDFIENKYEEAREKFTDIVQNCNLYGLVRKVKEALEEF